MEDSLNYQFINAIKDMYLKELNNKYNGLLRVTCRNITKYLLYWYGKITNADIESNN